MQELRGKAVHNGFVAGRFSDDVRKCTVQLKGRVLLGESAAFVKPVLVRHSNSSGKSLHIDWPSNKNNSLIDIKPHHYHFFN